MIVGTARTSPQKQSHPASAEVRTQAPLPALPRTVESQQMLTNPYEALTHLRTQEKIGKSSPEQGQLAEDNGQYNSRPLQLEFSENYLTKVIVRWYTTGGFQTLKGLTVLQARSQAKNFQWPT